MPFKGKKKGATELCTIDPGRESPAGNRDISPLVQRSNQRTRAFTLPTHATYPFAARYINRCSENIFDDRFDARCPDSVTFNGLRASLCFLPRLFVTLICNRGNRLLGRANTGNRSSSVTHLDG